MHTPAPPDTPLAQFFQLVPDGMPPRRADKSVGGVIPARALRYCEAITSASAFGWYVFLPMNFKVVWDGHDMLWTYPGVDEWLPLTRDAVQYPGFREHFDRHAPADVVGAVLFRVVDTVVGGTGEDPGRRIGGEIGAVSITCSAATVAVAPVISAVDTLAALTAAVVRAGTQRRVPSRCSRRHRHLRRCLARVRGAGVLREDRNAGGREAARVF